MATANLTVAQRQRANMRTKLFTGNNLPQSNGRGEGPLSEATLAELWPTYLTSERTATRPTLFMRGIQEMIAEKKTPGFRKYQPRELSEVEVDECD